MPILSIERVRFCAQYAMQAITVLKRFYAIAATLIEGGITLYQGSGLRDSGRYHLCGSTVAQRHPKRSKHHRKPEKQSEKGAKPAKMHQNQGFQEI